MADEPNPDLIEKAARHLFDHDALRLMISTSSLPWDSPLLSKVRERYRNTARALADAGLLADPEQHAELGQLRAQVKRQHSINDSWAAYGRRVKAEREQNIEQFEDALGLPHAGRGFWYERMIEAAAKVRAERDALQARIDAVPNILRQHYLAWIECDHDQKMDNPQCACSKVDLGWHPTVGDAVNAWIEHVRAVLQGDQPIEPQCIYVVAPGEGGRCIAPAIHDGLCAEHLAVVDTAEVDGG